MAIESIQPFTYIKPSVLNLRLEIVARFMKRVAHYIPYWPLFSPAFLGSQMALSAHFSPFLIWTGPTLSLSYGLTHMAATSTALWSRVLATKHTKQLYGRRAIT